VAAHRTSGENRRHSRRVALAAARQLTLGHAYPLPPGDVLAGFVVARASAGLADSTIRNDTGHLQLIRDWFGRPLWEMQPDDADV